MTKDYLIKKYTKRKAEVNKVIDYAEKIKAFHVANFLLESAKIYTAVLDDLTGFDAKDKPQETPNFNNHPQL